MAALCSSLLATWTGAQTGEVSFADLRAACLVNFLRYTTWPAGSFEDPEAPMVVAVVGDDEVVEALHAIVRRSVNVAGRRIEIRVPRLPGREIRDSLMFEKYLNNPREVPPTELLSEIYLPLK